MLLKSQKNIVSFCAIVAAIVNLLYLGFYLCNSIKLESDVVIPSTTLVTLQPVQWHTTDICVEMKSFVDLSDSIVEEQPIADSANQYWAIHELYIRMVFNIIITLLQTKILNQLLFMIWKKKKVLKQANAYL